jgi:WhiB family redox-sensing transcriptional regulator
MPGVEVSWRDSAACLGTFDPAFFPTKGHQSNRYAKAICATCPVTAECLDYSLTYRCYYGIWGGLTEAQRRKEKRRREAA